MSKEDELVNARIESYRSMGLYDDVMVEPEAHYNHYGTRGVADLFVKTVERDETGVFRSDYLHEIKSANAIKNATGANEIVRQYNKMRKTFYLDESRDVPDSIHMELTFTIEPMTVKHVAENFAMYASIDTQNLFVDSDSRISDERVMFRSANEKYEQPVQLINGNYERASTVEGWKDHLIEISDVGESAGHIVLDYID